MLLSNRLRRHTRYALLHGFRKHLVALSTSANTVVENTIVAEVQRKNPGQKSLVETTWHTLVVGEIVDSRAHPQADRLNICSVNFGDRDNLLQIVCGASNVHQGALVPVAKIGTQLAIKAPSGDLKKVKITKSKLRGEVSYGMICSEAELGLTDESDGVFILGNDAVVGTLVSDYGSIASRLEARGIPIQVPHSKGPASSA